MAEPPVKHKDPLVQELIHLRQEKLELAARLVTYKELHKAKMTEIDERIAQLFAELAGIGRASQRNMLYEVHVGGRLVGHGRNEPK